MEDCPRCKGVGKVNTPNEDAALGAKLKNMREKAGISLRAVARNMKKSPTYISRLEHGQERWNSTLEKEYRAAIDQ